MSDGIRVVIYLMIIITLPVLKVSAGYIIDVPGYYEISKDILNSTGKTLIEINTSNVMLNGNGHLLDGLSEANTYAIYIHNVSNVTIYNLTIKDWHHGIYVLNCSNVNIANTTIKNCANGVNIAGSTNIILLNNILIENINNGARLYKCENCSVISNYVEGNKWNGIRLNHSKNCTLRDNIILKNKHGICMNSSDDNLIFSNLIKESTVGVRFVRCTNDILKLNIILNNEKFGIFLKDECVNNSLCYNEISDNSVGIELINSYFNRIYNNTIYENKIYGIHFRSSNSNIVKYNNISYSYLGGICLMYSERNMIEYNSITSSTWDGIHLGWSSVNEVERNYIALNTHGVCLEIGNKHNVIVNNTLKFNKVGIHVLNSTLNEIKWNNITNNTRGGIFLKGKSSENLVFGNIIQFNKIGILLHLSCDNMIYNNYFENKINAYDDSINVWNVSKRKGKNIVCGEYLGGNYWSDYNGTDLDKDRIGDTDIPYNSGGKIRKGGDFLPLLGDKICIGEIY